MAKTSIDNIVTKVQRRADYHDPDTELDTLVIDMINDGLKLMKQWFFNEGMFDEIGTSTTLSTVASTASIDISGLTDLDAILVTTERTNDAYIPFVSFRDYRMAYPDPSAETSDSPSMVARYDNKLWIGPTPASIYTIYFDYIKLVGDKVSGDDVPFENKYDPLVIALAVEQLVSWNDSKAASAIQLARQRVENLKHELIVGAVKNLGMNRQAKARRAYAFGPQESMTTPTYGFGVGGFGVGGFGGA